MSLRPACQDSEALQRRAGGMSTMTTSSVRMPTHSDRVSWNSTPEREMKSHSREGPSHPTEDCAHGRHRTVDESARPSPASSIEVSTYSKKPSAHCSHAAPT